MKELILSELGREYTVKERDLGKYRVLKKSGMTFRISSYDVEGLGSMSTIDMKAMLGLMPVSAADAILTAEIFTPTCIVFMAVAALLSFWKFRSFDWCNEVKTWKAAVALGLFVLATLALFTQSYNPFLYFQF